MLVAEGHLDVIAFGFHRHDRILGNRTGFILNFDFQSVARNDGLG